MFKKIIFGMALLATSGIANAILIDFEDQGVAVGTQINLGSGVGFVSSGFNFNPGPINTSINDLHIHNQDGFGDNGTTNLGAHDDIAMSLAAGVFSIQSFDFEGFTTESNITIVGSLFGGGTISTTFFSDLNPNTYETFNFSNAWTGLTSVAFNYLGNASTGFFVDNIEVNARASVPEPSMLSLLALGLIGIGFLRKKKST